MKEHERSRVGTETGYRRRAATEISAAQQT